MASRKSEDDARRSAGGSPDGEGERPGSYVQMGSTPRRRKSSRGHAPIIAEDPASHRVDRVGSAAAKYQVDRTSSAPPPRDDRVERTFSAPRRGSVPGPLGMNEDPKRSESLTRTAVGMGPTLAEVQRALAERGPEPRAPAPESRVLVDSQAVRVERVHSIPAQAPVPVVARSSEISDATALRPRDPATPSQAPRAVSERPPARPSREEVASVFEARPSFRPSDPVPTRQGPSWGMVVGVAVLSSIIAAAGVVALQEVMRSREAAAPVAVAPASPVSPVTRVEPAKVAPTQAVGAAVAQEAPQPEPEPPAPELAANAPAVAPTPVELPAAAAPVELPAAAAPVELPAAAAPVAGSSAPLARPLPAKPAPRPAGAVAARPKPAAGPADGAPNRVLSGEFVAPEVDSEAAASGLPSNPYAD